ncbi:MAG: hypothetical protein IPM79_23020 [Polyangiaceae bacterium]|nr:hypothetical protein [Polyangiaceae bacterium]
MRPPNRLRGQQRPEHDTGRHGDREVDVVVVHPVRREIFVQLSPLDDVRAAAQLVPRERIPEQQHGVVLGGVVAATLRGHDVALEGRGEPRARSIDLGRAAAAGGGEQRAEPQRRSEE